MADNVTPLATDDIDGVLHSRVKLVFGPDGTATDVSYAKPLPANVAARSDAIYIGSASVAPIHVIISASSSTTATIVAALSGAYYRVLSYVITANVTGSVSFNSSVTPITGLMSLSKQPNIGLFNQYGHFQTGLGQPLTITTGDCRVGGHMTYFVDNFNPWLLGGGFWNDSGFWIDTNVWED